MTRTVTWILTAGLLIFLSGILHSQSAEKAAGAGPTKEKLIGAWRLAWLEEQQADGKMLRSTDRRGTLLYSRDGHMSVQIMLPQGANEPANPVKYDQGSYEAYYGTYDVDEKAHTVTHHVEGSVVRALVGKDLTRVYQFGDGQLILKSSRADEHWTIAWEHY